MSSFPRQLVRLLAFLVSLNASAAPVYRWDFGAEETSVLQEHGGVHRDVPGPRAPEFPDFDAGNTAALLDGKGAHFSFADPGPRSPLDFTNGDSITLEAWVNPSEISPKEAVVVVAKGRTGAAGFAADNQNWALRLRENEGLACVSFLFATPKRAEQPKRDAHWHRWTSKAGFALGSGWHHIAVAYRFGEPKTIEGWLDGRRVEGFWDMGGETVEAPVEDDDAVWLGSAQNGAANSYRGAFDAVAIHREIVEKQLLSQRFKREGGAVIAKAAPEVMPDLGALIPGKVQVTFHQGMPALNRWLNEGEAWPKETMRWELERFLLPRLPLLYEEWGIRDVWKGPVLVRCAADVNIAPGRHQFLLRAKGLSRVWLNGVCILRAKEFSKSPPDGEEPVAPVPVSCVPGLRAPGYGMQELLGEGEVPADGQCRVVLETLVGGPKLRAETGELCLSVQDNESQPFTLISARNGAAPLPLLDSAVEPELKRLAANLTDFETRTRREAAASQNGFWDKRHAVAKAWAQAHPAPSQTEDRKNPVDAFVESKIQRALDASAKTSLEEARFFHSKVLTILKDECFRCHGDKDKGGVRLNSRENAMKAGESGKMPLVPGDVSASEMLVRILSRDDDERMPPTGHGLKPEQVTVLEAWVKQGAHWPEPPVTQEDVVLSKPLTEEAFLRRLSLDVTGVPPTEAELARFLASKSADKRDLEIDRLLASPLWADAWMPYWLDVLAENPFLINPTLNTTGPFRWFLFEALQDNKAFDRFVSELVLLRGSSHTGGSAGFAVAGENDAPFATKGQIVATAFLGIELQCARCHDAPFHSSKQADLFSLAAMFERKPVTVPKTSMVPAAFFEKKARASLIKATLKPGEAVKPIWPFGEVTGCKDDASLDESLQKSSDSRERFAALLTAPQNTRFAQVIVNRVWKRFIGAGIVEPVADWEGHAASHPELLQWLATDFVAHGYDLKHLARRILTSQLYQREATGANLAAPPELRFFSAPERRRLSAEQVVDTLHAAAGQVLDTEELTFDPVGRRAEGARINLGRPSRAWMLANLTNDRDRPSLSLPYAQCVVDVLEAFGWNGARQSARTDREVAPNVLQPGVLANGALSMKLTRAAQGSVLADIAVEAASPEELTTRIFSRFLSRAPSPKELSVFADSLRPGFAERLVAVSEMDVPLKLAPLPRVTWFNHLSSEATTIALEHEKRARLGPPADPRLKAVWRERFEDFVWSVVNTREFVWMP